MLIQTDESASRVHKIEAKGATAALNVAVSVLNQVDPQQRLSTFDELVCYCRVNDGKWTTAQSEEFAFRQVELCRREEQLTQALALQLDKEEKEHDAVIRRRIEEEEKIIRGGIEEEQKRKIGKEQE